VKKLATILLLTTSIGVGATASATELPQYEVSGFPITPHQIGVLQPTKDIRESTPTTTPKEPHKAVMVMYGNERVHTIKFDIATQSEQEALVSALEGNPELAARIRSSKNILFVDGYEPLNVNLGE
jgi:hypothetical protein